MSRTFITRTADDDDDAAMDAVAAREQEIASYERNLDSYNKQLANLNAELPGEWPEGLRQFRGRQNHQIIEMGATQADAELASRLNHRERILLLAFTEKAELQKAELAYSVELDRLPTQPQRRSATLARWSDRRAAGK